MDPMTIGMLAVGSLMGGAGSKGGGSQSSVNAPITNNPINNQSFAPVNIFNSPGANPYQYLPSNIAPSITQPVTSGQDMRGAADPGLSLASPNSAYTADSSAPSGNIDTGMFGGNTMIIIAAVVGVAALIFLKR